MDVEDYTLKNGDGEHKLLSLFGDNSQLILVHNMGKSCPYCTIWASYSRANASKFISASLPTAETTKPPLMQFHKIVPAKSSRGGAETRRRGDAEED